MTRMATIALVCAAGLALVFALASPSALARGGHGFHGLGGRGVGGHGAGFAGGRRYGNDIHIKAASDENDKLLSRLKSICRGC